MKINITIDGDNIEFRTKKGSPLSRHIAEHVLCDEGLRILRYFDSICYLNRAKYPVTSETVKKSVHEHIEFAQLDRESSYGSRKGVWDGVADDTIFVQFVVADNQSKFDETAYHIMRIDHP